MEQANFGATPDGEPQQDSGPQPQQRVGGRYTIVAPISSGSMGAVYRARDAETDTDVAVKRLTDRRHAARFEIEARLLSQLRHPRVVRVLDHFQDETGKYLVMDLIEGIDLGRLVEERGSPGLPVSEAVEYARQSCSALEYVHHQQIIHRDVKPQNLILGPEGVVLVDFGIAREIGRESSGTVGVGTPRFMSPEVFAGGAVSARSDVFSLAATVWTLITGRAPVYADPTKLRDVAPDVTQELEETILAGLHMMPERRVASIGAFARALGAPLGDTQGESLALSLETPNTSKSLIEGIVRAAAGVFEAAASSIALIDRTTGELVYHAAWGSGAHEIVGVRMARGTGIAGAVAESGEAIAVPDCRKDPRFATQIAAGTGYVPNTMIVIPLQREGQSVGVLAILDRRDGGPFGQEDVMRAMPFAELTVTALAVDPSAMPSLGERTIAPASPTTGSPPRPAG